MSNKAAQRSNKVSSISRSQVIAALRTNFPGMARKIGYKTNEELAEIYCKMVLKSPETSLTVTHP